MPHEIENYQIQFKTEAEMNNFNTLLECTKVMNKEKKPLLTDWELEYLQRATPDLSNSPMFKLPGPNGEEVEVNAAQLIAYEIDKPRLSPDKLMKHCEPFYLWLDTENPLLKDLGFRDQNLDEIHFYAKTYIVPGKYTANERKKKHIYHPYKKYEMRHYGHSFSRPESQRSELEDLAKAFNFYYDYFKKDPNSKGSQQLKSFYPKLLNTDNYGDEASIMTASKSRKKSYLRLIILVPHISIAALSQCLQYVKCEQKRAKIRDCLKFALYSKLVYYTAAAPSTVRSRSAKKIKDQKAQKIKDQKAKRATEN